MNSKLFFTGTSLACSLTMGSATAFAETDWYFGGNVGRASEEISIDFLTGGNQFREPIVTLLGVHSGFNYDFGPAFVGVEGDIAFPTNGNFSSVCRAGEFCSLEYKAHLRGRIGLDFDEIRLFAAGGLVFADFEVNPGFSDSGPRSTRSLNGTTIGGGIEYMPEDENWSARIEVLYDRFDREVVRPGIYGSSASAEEMIIRAGLTFHFDLNGN